jgi:hypothetical protein
MNRLPPTTLIEDIPARELFTPDESQEAFRAAGEAAIRGGSSR